MIKKLLILCAVAMPMFVSCYDDTFVWNELREHEVRISRLETLSLEMNANIVSLQAILEVLQRNEYLTNIVAVEENGVVVGYMLTFTGGQTVTIYHGKDGQDEYVPSTGIEKDTDGVYYWVLDGEWMLDDDGNKIPATGRDGKDAITPEFRIVDGYWYISYDGGETWKELGQATGDRGPQGNPGVGGDSMFTDLDYSSSDDYVILYLNNGMQIKIPTWSAFEALKEQCQQANANIEALQKIIEALQDNVYVTSVTPVYDGMTEVGYIINFSDGTKVTIFHGEDGKDGQDGEDGFVGSDGHTPVIGVAKAEDGEYYWTLDGEWLRDDMGNKIPTTGKSGSGGSDGTPGESGKDGITPQLEIRDGYWWVSYDNGETWKKLGQATGDKGEQGEQGKPGVGGDSMFSDVDYSSSEDYVIFYLGNGEEIKVPTWSAFEALSEQCEMANKNIEALQKIIQEMEDCNSVTGVEPLYDGFEEIGYVITFSNGDKVKIYHGKDGTDGNVPEISAAKWDDGKYYWTLDGEWMLDANGKKIPAAGKDGDEAAVDLKLEIRDGHWFVSYDGGDTWDDLGLAQGPQGDPGVGGDSMFTDVDYTNNSEYVVLTLNNGQEILVPKYKDCAISMELLKVTGNTAEFEGTINRKSLDLKVTVYYATYANISVYKHVGSKSMTEFPRDKFNLRVQGLTENTQYYYFIEVVYNGTKTFSKVESFVTNKDKDSYIGWDEEDEDNKIEGNV